MSVAEFYIILANVVHPTRRSGSTDSPCKTCELCHAIWEFRTVGQLDEFVATLQPDLRTEVARILLAYA